MADKMTRGAWFNPIVIHDDDPVKLEDNPLPSTLHLPNGPPVTNSPPAIPLLNTTYPPSSYTNSVVNHSRNDLQRLLTCETEVSHLCNWRRCINPDHVTLESHAKNLSPPACFTQAQGHFGAGIPVKEACDIHNPPCLLQQAALPTTTKVINEWEAMGRPLPEALPEQMDCSNAELLTTPINQYTWVNNRRVVVRQYTIPEVNDEYHGTQAPGMM